MNWTVKFWPSKGGPKNKLAEAELHCGDPDSPFQGLKVVGFTVWKGERGLFATFPSRAYGAGGERRYFDYVRSQDPGGSEAGKAALNRLKKWLVSEYREGHPEMESQEQEREEEF